MLPIYREARYWRIQNEVFNSVEKTNRELLKGTAATIVLKVLSRREMYGYELIKAIGKESEGSFAFKEGTLYPLLHQLEQQGAILSRWEETQKARKRKYYHITQRGREVLADKTQEWLEFRAALDKLVAS